MKRTHEFNLTGAARKPLIEAIEDFTHITAIYMKAPTFSFAFYGVGVLDKNGALRLDCDPQVIMDLITWLEERGFVCNTPTTETDEPPVFEDLKLTEHEELGLGKERHDPIGEDGMQPSDVPESYSYRVELSDPDYPDRMEIITHDNDVDAYKEAREFCTGEVVLLELHQLDDDYNFVRGIDIPKLIEENNLYDRFSVEIPKNGLTVTQFQNLIKLADSKRSLLAKAIGRPLEIKETKENVLFIFPYSEETGIGVFYSQLAAAMIRYIKRHQRVTATEKAVESEKFALRTFMVKIGMNGAEYSACRKWFSRNLSGNASFSTNKKYVEMQENRKYTSNGEDD